MEGLEGPIIIIATKCMISVTEAEVGDSKCLFRVRAALTLEVKEMLSLALLGFYSSSKLSITSLWHIFPKEKVAIYRMSEAPSKQRSCEYAPSTALPGWRRKSQKQKPFISASSVTEGETLVFAS